MSFSQISSYVGASWRLIGNREMSEWNAQAATTREIYLQDLGKYKQTAEYKEYQNYLVDFRLKNSSSHQRLNRRSTSRRSSNVTNGGLEGSASFKGWLPLMSTSAFPQTQPQKHINSSAMTCQAKMETHKCTYCGYYTPIETPSSSTLLRHLSKSTDRLESGLLLPQLCLFDFVSDYTR
jgi:hypothetical protein